MPSSRSKPAERLAERRECLQRSLASGCLTLVDEDVPAQVARMHHRARRCIGTCPATYAVVSAIRTGT